MCGCFLVTVWNYENEGTCVKDSLVWERIIANMSVGVIHSCPITLLN